MTAKHPLGDVGISDFLANYWQKQPCLIRAAFPNFQAELDGDDLAGLSMDPMAESRIVKGTFEHQDWTVDYGPFNENTYAEIGDRDWTLLVQDVEKHYPPLHSLLECFDFIPTWRWDDLMVSFAAKGGSVGPHVDQYDVFLLQASGTKQWDLAKHFNPDELAGSDLKVLNSFTSEQSMVVEPGDLLYLPPGIAHHGVALSPGLTYSVGFRAPDSAVLFQAMGEYLESVPAENKRYADSPLKPPYRAGEIDQQAIAEFQSLLTKNINSNTFAEFLTSFLSRYRTAHEPAAPDSAISQSNLIERLSHGETLARNPWCRMVWAEHNDVITLYSSGYPVQCSAEFAIKCCAEELGQLDYKALPTLDFKALNLLLNRGHVYFTSE